MKKFSSNVKWSKYIDDLGHDINTSNAERYAELFYGVFDPICDWVKSYLYEHRIIPLEELQDEIDRFVKFFPKKERNELLKNRYFDDRLKDCIERFSQIQRSEIKMKILDLDFEFKRNSEMFKEHVIATKQDEERNSILTEGTEFLRNRKIRDFEDAKVRFEKTVGLLGFQSELKRFDDLFGDGFEKAYRDELKVIHEFINKAESLNVNDAFSDKSKNNKYHQYLRLKYDYYKNHNFISQYTYYSPSEIFAPLDSSIFGRYFLFRDWLSIKLKEQGQKQSLKTPKVKALFEFIQYLHSNIDNFNQYNKLIDELLDIKLKQNELKPLENYRDKQKFDELQIELVNKFEILRNNTAVPIKAKAEELNVCNFDNEPNFDFNGVQEEIRQLKENFDNSDLPEIFEHKEKYIEYRRRTHKTFLSLQFFFDELDEIAKSLFDYFKETEENEFEAFETKRIQVDSIDELIEHIQSGTKKKKLTDPFSIPYNGMFSISKAKTRFRLKNGSIETRGSMNETFDLTNSDIYDKETGELLEVAVQSKYNTLFLLKLGKMYTPNVKEFLTHQLNGSSNPKEFMDYVRYCALDSELVEGKGKRTAIQDWLEGMKIYKSVVKDETEGQYEPITFSELFYDPTIAEDCLNILRELQPPVIDAANNYIGKGRKGVFPLWVKVLKSHEPQPLIKHFKDTVYKDALNKKVKGLELSRDASEFRKEYKRLVTNNVEGEIKLILSQFSQNGKLGK